MDERLHALNRFGLGARSGEARSAALSDPRGWLRIQLQPRNALLPADAGLPGPDEVASALARQREAQRQAQRGGDAEAVRAARLTFADLIRRESSATLDQRVRTETPFVERLVAFWSNHLCVSTAASPAVAAWAGHYERTAIRPHVLGRFEDMVLAATLHPAMLLYLDNVRSVGPDSQVGLATGRRGNGRGLNENHARELLELHTLGVGGGYTQADVEAAARVLTGWTVDPGNGAANAMTRPRLPGRQRPGAAVAATAPVAGPAGSVFRPEIHEPGTKEVLGTRYGPGGAEEAEALVRDLARHPSTATFVATKLARHFVADEPPAAAVTRLAAVFRDSGGDLRQVALSLVEVEEAWGPANRKLRTPQEWAVAALRASDARSFPPALLPVLRELRHPLWAPAAPKGFDDVTRAWADPDALMNRAELARTLAARLTRGPDAADPRRLLEVMAPTDGGTLATMLADGSIPADERFALALGGPAFQWR
jgi:uncharacterized protein (DUF1800 family)